MVNKLVSNAPTAQPRTCKDMHGSCFASRGALGGVVPWRPTGQGY